MSPNPEDFWTSDRLVQGDIDAIRRRALDDPDYLRGRDSVGDTPLLSAIDHHQIGLIEFMIRHGADPDPVVEDGYTSLLSAVESTDPASIRIVSLLIEAGADIHRAGIHGWTPLHMAAARGQVEKARLLIEAGARVDERKEIDAAETPLMEAAEAGHAGMVRLLLESGADPWLRDMIHERTALEAAEFSRNGPDPDVIEHLKTIDFGRINDELLASLDASPEMRVMMESILASTNAADQYREAAEKRAREGDFEEVIRLLNEFMDRG